MNDEFSLLEAQQDIHEQMTQEAHIAFQATHDLHTELPNRTAFTSRLEEAFQRTLQEAGLLTVMYLDLDGFKAINDGLGHHVGNQVLATAARRLVALLRLDDVVARPVGDVSGILLTNCGGRAQAIQLAERILDSLAQPIQVGDQLIHPSVSIACNCLPLEQPHELVQHAGLALEQAKRQGRNTWQWYPGRRVKQNLTLAETRPAGIAP